MVPLAVQPLIDATRVLALAATVFLTVAVVVAARHKSAYSHLRHTISELGEYGDAHSSLVSLGVFLPVSVALLGIALLVRTEHPPAAALALALAVGYGSAALFPCDPGAPMSGSFRQAVHTMGGGVQYVGGAFALFWLAETGSLGYRTAGFLVFIAAVLVSFPGPLRGAVQRVAEVALFLSLSLALSPPYGSL